MTLKTRFADCDVVATMQLIPFKDAERFALGVAAMKNVVDNSKVGTGVPAALAGEMVHAFFPKHLISLSGLTSEDGAAFTIEDVCSQVRFVPLLGTLTKALVLKSMTPEKTH